MFKKILHWLTTWTAVDPAPVYSPMDLADPSIAGEVSAKQRFDDTVNQYYWDVKMNFTPEKNVLAVPCPYCGAGIYQECHRRTTEVADTAGTHIERHDYLVDVHIEFAMLDGRDRA